MEFHRVTLENCAQATGLVIVIDVLRAFTTAAFALEGGAEKIILVSGHDEALALRDAMPGALVMGEIDGLPPPGFDLGNSPAQFEDGAVNGRTLIQRTSSGTQGVVRSVNADGLLVASFVVAQATVDYVQQQRPQAVTFVITGYRPDGRGDEDAACADYLQALLRGERPDPASFLQRVRDSKNGRFLRSPDVPSALHQDVDCAVALDRFDFAMPVQRREGQLVVTAVGGSLPDC